MNLGMKCHYECTCEQVDNSREDGRCVMAGEGLILDNGLLHLTSDPTNPIVLQVSGTSTEDDPQIQERLYADGRTRGIVGFRDTKPFTVTITKMRPQDLDILLDSSGKTAVYRPDSDLGFWNVIVGKVKYDQDPRKIGDEFKVRLTMHRRTDRS